MTDRQIALLWHLPHIAQYQVIKQLTEEIKTSQCTVQIHVTNFYQLQTFHIIEISGKAMRGLSSLNNPSHLSQQPFAVYA